MKYQIQNKEYPVIVERKHNKNTYIRIKEDGTIYITTSYFTTTKQIEHLLEQHSSNLIKMIEKIEKKQTQKEQFYFLGKPYEIIYMPPPLEIHQNRIFVKDLETLEKWLKKETKQLFEEHLNFWYHRFEEKIPFPKLKIRKMKTRWGVCNRRDNSVTLNSELIRYEIEQLDYVIIHELSHFVHFNHSKNFWHLVSKYCPNYKQARKVLKE